MRKTIIILCFFISNLMISQNIGAVKLIEMLGSNSPDTQDYLISAKWKLSEVGEDSSVFSYSINDDKKSLFTIYKNSSDKVVAVNIITKSENIFSKTITDLKNLKAILKKNIIEEGKIKREYKYKKYNIHINITPSDKNYDSSIFDVFIF